MIKYTKFIFLIISLFVFSITQAGVVPGTIQKGTGSANFQCGVGTTSYVTSNSCNGAGSCNRSCDSRDIYNNCTGGSYKSSGGENYWSSSTSYNDYTSASQNPTYNGSVKLTNDTQTCNPRTTGVSSDYTSSSYLSCTAGSCGSGGSGTKYTPRHGYCSSATSVKTIISSYDQIGNRTYSFNNSETTQYNSNRNTNLTATCEIEGRYATSDTTAPTASINGVSNIFVNNDKERCNIKKYRSEGYSYKVDENPGCEYYRKLNTVGNPSGTQDLLKNLEINIPYDVSGISEVQVRLGNCSYTYTPDTTNLSNILVSTTSPSGVRTQYINAFTIKYDQSVNALGKTQPSLLSAFGKTRLDECLEEGKNSIAILIKDMARSTADGTTLSPNIGTKFTKGTINIDNSTPKLQLSGDLSTTALSGTTTIGGATNNATMWRNYTLNGNIQQGEEYKGGIANECKSFSGALTGQCSESLVGGKIWTAPSGVNPTTGKFMQYTCGDLGKFPTESECASGCPSGQTWDPNKNTCLASTGICKAFVGGAEVVIENGKNGVVTGTGPKDCMGYCIPGHSVGCVVKKSVLPGVCGTANGTSVMTQPTSNLCTTGTPSSVTGTGPWNWTCSGIDGGAPATCSANKTATPTDNYCTLDATLDCILEY